MPSHYLALPLKSSKPAKSVICRITGSPHSFPLTVTATDGEFGFSKKLTKKDVEAGKSGSFDGSVSEWLDILFNALFSLDGDCGEGRKNGDDVAISAQISRRKDILSINIERDDEDITYKIGALDIPFEEDVEIDLVEWLIESANATITAQAKARKLEKETSSEHDAIAKLKTALDTLTKAKEDYETELLKKFNALLDEKKAKIRELTNNGPVPGAKIPSSPEPTPEPSQIENEDGEEDKPKRGHGKTRGRGRGRTTTVGTSARSTKVKAPAPARRLITSSSRGKRKRPATPEPPEEEERDEDTVMPDTVDDNDVTADEESDQGGEGGDERDRAAAQAFGRGRDDEGELTEDEEL